MTNTVTISGVAAPVFDLVTTARFWPQWHPASRAVGGVTQRPFQLDDRIHRGEASFVRERPAWSYEPSAADPPPRDPLMV